MFPKDQIPGESFDLKERIRVYLVGIDAEARGNGIRISRTHSGFFKILTEIQHTSTCFWLATP